MPRTRVLVLGVAILVSAQILPADDPDDSSAPLIAPGSLRVASAAIVPGFAVPSRVRPPEPVSPWIHATMPNDVRSRLEDGFRIAVKKIQTLPECRALFQSLGADPEEILSTGLYFPVRSHLKEKRACGRNVAISYVGSPTTFLCRDFARMSDERAAMYVIHEALHHAGLGERPLDPTAMTSREINAMVVEACGL
jgi:hypothetical protein